MRNGLVFGPLPSNRGVRTRERWASGSRGNMGSLGVGYIADRHAKAHRLHGGPAPRGAWLSGTVTEGMANGKRLQKWTETRWRPGLFMPVGARRRKVGFRLDSRDQTACGVHRWGWEKGAQGLCLQQMGGGPLLCVGTDLGAALRGGGGAPSGALCWQC